MPRSLRRVVMVMTDLPKTREYELFRNRAKYTTQIAGHLIVRQDKADAMRDELLGRISELEDVLEMESENRTSMTARIEELEASLKLMTEYGYWKGRAERAEAALAKMTDAAETLAGMASAAWSDEAQAAAGEVLRVARAEEGSEDE